MSLRNFFEGRQGQPGPVPEGTPAVLDPEPVEAAIEAESKDPSVLGKGGPHVRCRICGRDMPAIIDKIPPDAECPRCGAVPFEFDVSQ